MDSNEKKNANKEEKDEFVERNPLKTMFIIYAIIIFFLVVLPLISIFLSPHFKVFHYILQGYDWFFYQIKNLFLAVKCFLEKCYYWAFD